MATRGISGRTKDSLLKSDGRGVGVSQTSRGKEKARVQSRSN